MSDGECVLGSQPSIWADQEEEEGGGGGEGEQSEAATVDKLLQGEKLLIDLDLRKSKGIRIYVSCPPNGQFFSLPFLSFFHFFLSGGDFIETFYDVFYST